MGTISFTPTDGNQGPSAGGNIDNGEYEIPKKLGPVLGMNLVTITGTEDTSQNSHTSVARHDIGLLGRPPQHV